MGLLMRRRRPVMRLAVGATAVGTASHRDSPAAARGAVADQAPDCYAATQGAPAATIVAPAHAARAAALVRGIEASVAGDSSVIERLYTSDVKAWTPAMSVSSAAELAVEFEDRDEAFSEIELELAPLDVSGDRACVEWIATATHSGPIVVDDDLEIAPTGRRCRLRGVTIAEFEGDRIRSFRQYWDEISLIEQLGLMPD
jgi:ketosteroid isomerase-like protein